METPSLVISSRLSIPLAELTFTASRSSGPGGQHVNKVSTRVTLLFDVAASPSLTESDKERLMTELGGRIGKDGVLQLSVQTTRSQSANREIALERFAALVRAALTPVAVRRKTKASRAARQRRLDAKKHRSTIKRQRSGSPGDDA